MAEQERKITSLDDMFGLKPQQPFDVPGGFEASEVIVECPRHLIDPLPNNPFRCKPDDVVLGILEDMEKTGKPDQPSLLRPVAGGRYQLIAGQKRNLACEIAQRPTLNCIIREMTDDEAIIAMVRSNNQRETLLYSEKAFAYQMRMAAEQRQGQRPGQTTSRHRDGKSLAELTAEKIGADYGDKAKTVERTIRLTHLLPELLELTDNSLSPDKDLLKLGFMAAHAISFLNKDEDPEKNEQLWVYQTILSEQCTPTKAQAEKMKEMHETGELSLDKVLTIMSQPKGNQQEKITLKQSEIENIFPRSFTAKQKHEIIIQLLQKWKRDRERNQQER